MLWNSIREVCSQIPYWFFIGGIIRIIFKDLDLLVTVTVKEQVKAMAIEWTGELSAELYEYALLSLTY